MPAWTVVVVAILLCPLNLSAEDDVPGDCSARPKIESANAPAETGNSDKRIFGVLPNYRTVESSSPFQPLTARQKLGIAAKDSFDWPTFLVTGAFAMIYQAENQNVAFGQGLQGYAKRYGGSFGDQVIGNMLAEGFLPVLLHEDPRYFRAGSGATGARLKSAVAQILLTRTDSGSRRFNISEWLGNGAGVGISNLYYSDSRSLHSNVQRFSMQLGTDALSNVLKEFWPDIKHRFFQKHQN